MSWTPEGWAHFEQCAVMEAIQWEMNAASQQMLTAELWHRRLSVLLDKRLRQVSDGTWPVASTDADTGGEG